LQIGTLKGSSDAMTIELYPLLLLSLNNFQCFLSSFLFPPSSLVRDKSQFRVIVERQEINKGAMMVRRQQLYEISHEGSLSLVPRVWSSPQGGVELPIPPYDWGKEAVKKHLVPFCCFTIAAAWSCVSDACISDAFSDSFSTVLQK